LFKENIMKLTKNTKTLIFTVYFSKSEQK